MYRVIKMFTDLQDNNYKYAVGDEFPHSGFEVSPERLEELSTDKNRRKVPLIEFVEDNPKMVYEKPELIEGEPVEDFMNKPVSEEKPKRTRKKKNAE